MAYYYKISDDETVNASPSEGILVYEEKSDRRGPCITYDFSKHVLIELLDNVTPETKLWTELGLDHAKNIIHKRMLVDPHRVNCRRAVVVCSTSEEARALAQRLSQLKIMKRSICAVVIQELLSDICLFENQIIQYGDKRSQHQLVYVTELARRREASGLAQYLREKFSPFGTILSVLVSEDKDGYAYPEGVIKFAHLSEAFAAELAYDQCAVALERLSVTTHHNILLCQCDLRARLREAYSRQSSEFSFNIPPESEIKVNQSNDTNLDDTKILSCSNPKSPAEELSERESALNVSSSTVNSNNEFQSDSAELADVLKKPCESNLVDCLQGIAACSESTISRRASTNSQPLTEIISSEQLDLTHSANSSISKQLNKTWSSRIVGWITDLPNIEPSSQVRESVNDVVADSNVHNSESTALTNIEENMECNQQSKQTNVFEVVSSNTSSFVTCNNGDLNSSFHTIPSSPNDSDCNNVTMVGDELLSHSPECHSQEISDEETSNVNGSRVLSLKRKNSSMLTQKLSLKSKKFSTAVQDHETTIHLSSVSENKSSVVLNSDPEFAKIVKIMSLEQPAVVLERVSVSQLLERNLKNEQGSMLNTVENKAKSKKKFSKKGIGNDTSSVKSLSVRRSSRLTTRDSDKGYNSFSSQLIDSTKPLPLENSTKPLPSPNFVDQGESPLRVWLRKELDLSTNSQVTMNKESTKSIVCASTNKDVIISVGCSHMTCDFCYPDSTKLLLGFH